MNSEVGSSMPKDSSGVSGFNLNIPICHSQGNQTNVELEVGHMMPKESSGVSGFNLNIPIFHLQGNQINVELSVRRLC